MIINLLQRFHHHECPLRSNNKKKTMFQTQNAVFELFGFAKKYFSTNIWEKISMKIKFILLICFVLVAPSSAQTFRKGTVLINFGLGAGLKQAGYVSMLEVGATNKISVGVVGMMQSNSILGLGSNVYNRYDLGVRGSYHFGKPGQRADPYLGVHVGQSSYAGNYIIETEDPKKIALDVYLGTRFLFRNERLGIFVEGSLSVMNIRSGFSINLKK